MLTTVIGRGHSGTRAMSHTLSASGVFMGSPLNGSGDLLPPGAMYDACRLFARYVDYRGGLDWDFTRAIDAQPDPKFVRLVNKFLKTVRKSNDEHKGWKLPETTLCYPWIVKMFPDARYIHWVRDPRDCILASHLTDDLHDFGIDYPATEDIRLRRAYSWMYQREIVRATPPPKHVISVRFEDMVLDQTATLKRIGDFLGIELAQIEMRPDSVGRWKTAEGPCNYDFFAPELKEFNYI